MSYAEFRDKFFNMLFKIKPIEERLSLLPEGRTKIFLQRLDYNIDRIFIFLFLWVMLPGIVAIEFVVLLGGVR